MKTQDARSLSPEAQEDLRRKAVRAVVQDGKTRVEAARLLGLHRNVVGEWVKVYRERGWRALRSRPRGRPRKSRLTGVQAATIVRQISDRCPDQLHLPFYLWTREAVGALIQRRTGLALSKWTVGRYLQRWGLTPQKPARRAWEQNPQAVQRWLDQEYPAIHRAAVRENAEIYWGDEAGFRSDHVAGTSYSPRGQTPIAEVTGKRFGGNMISAITNRGHLAFMIFRGRFVTQVYLDFLRRLTRHARRKVYLIVDRHPVHLARRVGQWLAEHADRIRVHYLPPYSPELNPDEYLNQDVKTNAVGRQRPRNAEELLGQVEGYLQATRRYPSLVRRYFNHEKVRYAAETA
jgi:transposase